MVARRLLIVMVVLLLISALSTVLVADRATRDEVGNEEDTSTSTTASTTTTESESDAKPGDPEEPLTAVILVGGEKFPVVPIEIGPRLTLVVKSELTDQVEIPALGLLEPVAPGAPAQFELLLDEPDNYGLRLVQADRLVARLEVRSRAREESGRSGAESPRERGRSGGPGRSAPRP